MLRRCLRRAHRLLVIASAAIAHAGWHRALLSSGSALCPVNHDLNHKRSMDRTMTLKTTRLGTRTSNRFTPSVSTSSTTTSKRHWNTSGGQWKDTHGRNGRGTGDRSFGSLPLGLRRLMADLARRDRLRTIVQGTHESLLPGCLSIPFAGLLRAIVACDVFSCRVALTGEPSGVPSSAAASPVRCLPLGVDASCVGRASITR